MMVLRLENVMNCSSRVRGEGAPQVTVEMDYLPECSKNSYKLRNGVIKSAARNWMDDLAWMVKQWSNSCGIELEPPVTIRIGGIFKDKRNCPDTHNFIIIIADAIQEGLGINDRNFKIECDIPEINPLKTPRIIVTVS